MRHVPNASTARQSARSDDRHSMSQTRLAAWRGRIDIKALYFRFAPICDTARQPIS